MEYIMSLCSLFSSKYNNFLNSVGVDIEYDPRLSELEFEIVDNNNNRISYDYDSNKIYVSRNSIDSDDFEFEFYRKMLEVLATKKQDDILYNGVSYSGRNNSSNVALNDMLSRYMCNAITAVDTNDVSRVFISKIEKIIEPNEIVDIYFSNDVTRLNSYLENLGINLDTFNNYLEILENVNRNPQESYVSIGTDVDKVLIDAIVNKYIRDERRPINYSDIEISEDIVSDLYGFEGIKNNEKYFYNKVKSVLPDVNISKSL